METEKRKHSKTAVVIALLCILLIVMAAAVVVVVFRSRQADVPAENEGPTLQFATEGVTAIDQESLQKAVDELMNAPQDSIGLYYKNDALSSDGTNFSCYLGNSPANEYNAFYALYADADLTDLVFLSDLLRPGEVFESITLDHALPEGTTTVYCALTLVEEDLETIHDQVIFTADFTYR